MILTNLIILVNDDSDDSGETADFCDCYEYGESVDDGEYREFGWFGKSDNSVEYHNSVESDDIGESDNSAVAGYSAELCDSSVWLTW